LPLAKGNDAIHANPSNDDIGLTTHGSDWLWAVLAVMLISDLAMIGWMMTLRRGQRMFHLLPIIILTTASVAYFSMASNLGRTGVVTEFRARTGTTRSIWYVRYIDWTITTPLLLLELLLATGLSLSEIVTVIFFDLAMIVVGLVGALVASSYKWGYFTFGVVFEFYIWWVLLGPARTTAGLLGGNVRSAYTRSATYLMVLWALYPVCWALAEGSNTISMTGEMIFYGILDILAKPVFCFLHISALRGIPYETFGFSNGAGRYTEHGAAITGIDDKRALRGDGLGTASNFTSGTHPGSQTVGEHNGMSHSVGGNGVGGNGNKAGRGGAGLTSANNNTVV